MKLKTIVTTVAAAGMAVAGSVYAADSASLQTQINQLQAQVNAMGNSSAKSVMAFDANSSSCSINSSILSRL